MLAIDEHAPKQLILNSPYIERPFAVTYKSIHHTDSLLYNGLIFTTSHAFAFHFVSRYHCKVRRLFVARHGRFHLFLSKVGNNLDATHCAFSPIPRQTRIHTTIPIFQIILTCRTMLPFSKLTPIGATMIQTSLPRKYNNDKTNLELASLIRIFGSTCYQVVSKIHLSWFEVPWMPASVSFITFLIKSKEVSRESFDDFFQRVVGWNSCVWIMDRSCIVVYSGIFQWDTSVATKSKRGENCPSNRTNHDCSFRTKKCWTTCLESLRIFKTFLG